MSHNKRLAVLISDAPGSGLDTRARALFSRLSDRYEITFLCHTGTRLSRIRNFSSALLETQPALIYLIDPIYAGVTATWLYRLSHPVPVMLDTGDLVYDLAKEMGRLGRVELGIVKWAEQTALKMATTIVVRGSFHRDWLMEHGYSSVQVIPDGADLREFCPIDASDLRARLGLHRDEIVVGGVGTIDWNTRRHTCFGWDLVEALPLVRGEPVKGLLIGDGSGRTRLEVRARELGVADKIIFTGRVAHSDLPRYLNVIDICLLSAPNATVSRVRTTGKLSEYLACDRYVIATKIGTAASVLPSEMLLPYEGSGRDPAHPIRLAEKIRSLVKNHEQLRLNGRGVALARQHFDYDVLAHSLASIIERTLCSY